MSSSPFDLSILFSHIVRASPFLIVAFAGIALCMTRESRPLRVRVAVGCALAVQFVGHLILPLFYGYLLQSLQSGGAPVGGNSLGIMLIGLISSSSSAVALGLLLFAAFTRDDQFVESSRS